MMSGKRNIALLILSLPILAFVYDSEGQSDSEWSEKGLAELRDELGDSYPDHHIQSASAEDIEIGRQLIFDGRADRGNGKSAYISKFYACTSCHNTVREDPYLDRVDSESRLDYAIEQDIPYLQASTFWGIVNRKEWYNDDYVKKYGDLVLPANGSLKESIQLCAQECSQGRELEEWEMQAMLAYLSSLEVKVSDLDLSEDEVQKIRYSKISNEAKLAILDEAFLPRSPATFAEPVSDRKAGYGLEGRAEKGKAIYELSCQHCHKEDGVSDLVLDDAKKTFRWMRRKIDDSNKYSIYEIIRKGTYAEFGHREYMPLYTQEKLSDQQIEDLRAYIEEKAK